MNDIKIKVNRIKDMQHRLISELKDIQNNCPHEDKEGKYKGDTGNWSPDEDSYWIDAKCLDCGKTWMIDSEGQKQEYRNFNGKKIQ